MEMGNGFFETILSALNPKNIMEKIKEILDDPKSFSLIEELGDIIDDVKLLYEMLCDYFKGEYKEIPWKFLVAIVGAFIYLISPVDLIPDFLPFVGFTDDAAVFGFVISTFIAEIEKYREWKKNN
ncbi:MAG: DUF1232 domain-containing protein [Victivallaceae bacterium]|nr:DUF1232 domain-containing protein [Victivallaceae bacterium]